MERREYQRVNVEATGSFYIHNNEDYVGDFPGVIKDVSEGGVRIETDLCKYESILSKIEVGGTISFDAMDEYKMYNDMVTDIFNGKVRIVRKSLENNTIVLGCKIIHPSDCLDEYIKNRKTSIYISNIRNRYSI